jgi:hypothetical protein
MYLCVAAVVAMVSVRRRVRGRIAEGEKGIKCFGEALGCGL